MYRIKSIEKTGSRFVVKVSGDGIEAGFAETYLVAGEFFLPLGVNDGDMIDDASLEALSSASDLTAAVSKALDALSYSVLSRRALTEKLRFKYRIDKETAERAADYAVKRGYLDEDAQAKDIAERCVRGKLWGKRRIAAELYSKGYPREVAETAADSIPDGSYAAALEKLIDKKAKTAPADGAEHNRLVSSLIRLGHSPSAVKEALAERFGEEI